MEKDGACARANAEHNKLDRQSKILGMGIIIKVESNVMKRIDGQRSKVRGVKYAAWIFTSLSFLSAVVYLVCAWPSEIYVVSVNRMPLSFFVI